MRNLPKKGDKFNAYTKEKGNLARGAPFTCKYVEDYKVYATDNWGNSRLLVSYNNNPDDIEPSRGFIFEVLGLQRKTSGNN